MKEFFKKHKTACYLYIIWAALHLCLLAAGNNNYGFYPWNEYGRCEFLVGNYGFAEFCFYVILIPACIIAYLDLVWYPNADKREVRKKKREEDEALRQAMREKEEAEKFINQIKKIHDKQNEKEQEEQKEQSLTIHGEPVEDVQISSWFIILICALILTISLIALQ